MYHKLGPRPPGVRLKGLYVSSALFERQLTELCAGGFRSASLDTWNSSRAPAAREMLLTFDDGFENVLQHGLEPLQRHGFQAIQFLLPTLLGKTNEWEIRQGEAPQRLMDARQVREWLAAGHDIGAHTCTHPWLTQIPLDQAREEILASKARLEDLFGRPIRHFCYPYGDWNPAVRDAVADAGFQTACTTVPGRNRPEGDPFRLRRLTARHASRNWKSLWRAVRALFGR
jgi:peptidoglycan/xylan/chitin deacetylase (PgdA/CDA1 family)